MSDKPDGLGLTVDLSSHPDWQTQVGNDKTISASGGGKTFNQFAVTNYLVPAGKTLYIWGISCISQIEGVADAGKAAAVLVQVSVGAIPLALIGGVSGGFINLNRPSVVSAGDTVALLIINNADATCTLAAVLWCVEV
jgi:hypothetical protein